MAAPTAQELELLPKFRSALADLNLKGALNTDLGLIQWLRAREHNLAQAEDMLRKSLKWREENDIDNILSWQPPAELLALCPISYTGYDKENSPVCVMHFGQWNLRKIIELGLRDDYMKYRDQVTEKVLELMKGKTDPTTGLPVTQSVMVVDNKGLSFSTLTCIGAIDMIREGTRRLEANYPETLKRVIAINASRVFTAAYAVVKPIMSKRTIDKIRIIGSNPDKWKAALLEFIPKESLPVAMGGTYKTAVDDSAIVEGEADGDNHIAVTIAPGSKLPLEMEVEKADSVLSWSFSTEDSDIGFSVVLDLVEIVEFKKYDSHLKRIEGSVVCQHPGNYVLTFDNSYSMVREKVLKYCIDVS